MEKLPILDDEYLRGLMKMSDQDLFDCVNEWNNVLYTAYKFISDQMYIQLRIHNGGLTEKEQKLEDYEKTIIPRYMSAVSHIIFILENRLNMKGMKK